FLSGRQEAVVGDLDGLGGDLRRLDVQARAGPSDGDDLREGPRRDRLVLAVARHDRRGAALDPRRHAREPLGDLDGVRPERAAELDVRELQAGRQLPDMAVEPALLALLDHDLDAEALATDEGAEV